MVTNVNDPAKVPEERQKLVDLVAGGDVTSLAEEEIRRAREHLQKAPYWKEQHDKLEIRYKQFEQLHDAMKAVAEHDAQQVFPSP